MKKLLFTLGLLVSFNISSQNDKKILECNCDEKDFRQTFEINFNQKKIKHISSVDLKIGKYYLITTSDRPQPESSKTFFTGTINKGFIVFSEYHILDLEVNTAPFYSSIRVRAFNLELLELDYTIYSSTGNIDKSNYKCFWLNK